MSWPFDRWGIKNKFGNSNALGTFEVRKIGAEVAFSVLIQRNNRLERF
jgi:hypothetical protein